MFPFRIRLLGADCFVADCLREFYLVLLTDLCCFEWKADVLIDLKAEMFSPTLGWFGEIDPFGAGDILVNVFTEWTTAVHISALIPTRALFLSLCRCVRFMECLSSNFLWMYTLFLTRSRPF